MKYTYQNTPVRAYVITAYAAPNPGANPGAPADMVEIKFTNDDQGDKEQPMGLTTRSLNYYASINTGPIQVGDMFVMIPRTTAAGRVFMEYGLVNKAVFDKDFVAAASTSTATAAPAAASPAPAQS